MYFYNRLMFLSPKYVLKIYNLKKLRKKRKFNEKKMFLYSTTDKFPAYIKTEYLTLFILLIS